MGIVKKLPTPATKKLTIAKEVDTAGLTLPTMNSKAIQDMQDVFWLLYGERKIGKSSLAACFPSAFFMMFEPGGKSLEIKQASCQTWEHALQYVKLLENNPAYCKTVVIDTGFKAYEKCTDYVCKRDMISHPSDAEWGKGWDAVRREFYAFHERILNLGLGMIVTAHSEIKDVNRRDGSKYQKLSVELGKTPFTFYAGIADIIAYYQYNEKNERELTIRGDSFVEAGCRLVKNFNFTDGTPVVHIPIGNKGAKEGYQILCDSFANKLIRKIAIAKK